MDTRQNGNQGLNSTVDTTTQRKGGGPMMFVSDLNAVQEFVQTVKVAGAAVGPQAPARVRLEQALLVVASGGSGKEIATQLKAAFIERFGEVPENVVILCFDNASETVAVREGRHGRLITLEDNREFIALERVPVTGIKRALNYHGKIVGRMGKNLQRITRASIGDGCAQERPQGQLALLWNMPKIVRAIDNAIRRLIERSDDLNRAGGERSGINVVFVESSCGGQGSGALPDLVQITHRAFRNVGNLEESSRFIGVFLLPGAFAEVHGPNLLPNTQAFFLELDATMQGAGFKADYPGNIQVDNPDAPFDVVFVLNGIDEHGQAFASKAEVCEHAARSLVVLLGSEVGMREIFAAVNEQGVLRGVSTAGWGAYLATLGQASLRFPAQPTADRCVLRLAAEMAAASQIVADATAVPAVTLVGASTLRDRLRLNANGAPYDTQLTPPVSLEQAPSEEQPTLARTLTTNFVQRRIHETAFGQVKETTRRLITELRGELQGGLTLAQTHGNLAVTAAWLRAAADALQTQYGTLLIEAERLAVATESSQKALDAASASMDQAAESLPFLRKGRVRTAVNRYLDEAGNHIRLRLEQRVAEAAVEVAHTVLGEARGRSQQAAEALVRVEQARGLLREREADLARQAVGRSEINLATPELVERLYAQYRTDPAALLQQVSAGAAGGALTWGQLAAEQVAARLIAAAERPFQDLRAITVEDVLAAQWDDRSAQQWIKRLAGLAAGAWNLDTARLPEGGAALASFLTIGVPDETASIFANCGETLVSTHDPERIVALRTVYGASYDALKGVDEWQRAYEQALARNTPLHVLALPDAKCG